MGKIYIFFYINICISLFYTIYLLITTDFFHVLFCFNRFDPHKKPVEAIANAIKENPGEGYPNWKKVPDHIRRLWFEAFQVIFKPYLFFNLSQFIIL